MRLQKALLYGLVLILLAAPLPFGAVQPGVTAILAAASLGLGAIWVIGRSRRGLPALPWRDPVLIAGALFVLLGVAQTVPLPGAILRQVSPSAVDLRERYEPATPVSPDVASGSLSPSRESSTPGVFLYSGWRPVSLYPWATRQATVRLLAYLVAALITIDLAASGAQRLVLAGALVASGGFQAIYGLAEFFSGHQRILGYVKKYYTDVATGTFINRNHFAGYLEMTLPLAVALSAGALSQVISGSGGPSLGGRLASAPGRLIFAAGAFLMLALVMAIALVCSRSRMGVASALISLVLVGLYVAWRGRGKGFAVAAAVVVCAALLLLSQSESGGLIADRFSWTVSDFHGAVGRGSIWAQTFQMMAAFPVAGIGLGTFRYVFPAFRSTGEGVEIDHAHSDVLEVAAEVGAIGCLIIVVGAGLVVLSAVRRPARRPDFGPLAYATITGVVALSFHSMTDFNLAIPSNALTFSVLLGMVIAWLRVPTPALAAGPLRGKPRLARIWATAGVFGVIALIALIPAAAAAQDQRLTSARSPLWISGGWPVLDGDDAERLFRVAAAEREAAMADLEVLVRTSGERADTGRSAAYIEHRVFAAMLLQVTGLRHLPTSSGGHLDLALLRGGLCAARALAGATEANCVAGAIPDLQAALRLDRMSATRHAQAARFLLASWNALDDDARAAAQEIIERALRLNPGDRSLVDQWATRDRLTGAG